MRRLNICKIARRYCKNMSIHLGIDMGYKEAEELFSKEELEQKFNEQIQLSIYANRPECKDCGNNQQHQ